MRKEVRTNQQSQAPRPPITSGHTTLTFSGPVKPVRDETYVNKVFQQNDQPLYKNVCFLLFYLLFAQAQFSEPSRTSRYCVLFQITFLPQWLVAFTWNQVATVVVQALLGNSKIPTYTLIFIIPK